MDLIVTTALSTVTVEDNSISLFMANTYLLIRLWCWDCLLVHTRGVHSTINETIMTTIARRFLFWLVVQQSYRDSCHYYWTLWLTHGPIIISKQTNSIMLPTNDSRFHLVSRSLGTLTESVLETASHSLQVTHASSSLSTTARALQSPVV